MMTITLFVIINLTLMFHIGAAVEKDENKQQMARLKLEKAQADQILAEDNPSPEDMAKAKAIKEHIQAEVNDMPAANDYNKYLDNLGTTGIILGLLFLWCNLCLILKRMRDTGVSPWLMIVLAAAVACMLAPFPQAVALAPYCSIVVAAFYLFCMFYPSANS
ncbi:MAG TPA: hypothetical protein VLG38_07795 [Gammaproteobacteria bacterium]|nr:hypothetical protein [Gammaproteobacteria bacterium]